MAIKKRTRRRKRKKKESRKRVVELLKVATTLRAVDDHYKICKINSDKLPEERFEILPNEIKCLGCTKTIITRDELPNE